MFVSDEHCMYDRNVCMKHGNKHAWILGPRVVIKPALSRVYYLCASNMKRKAK